MERFRILRIVLMIACIFAAGICVGRFLMPPVEPVFTLMASGGDGRAISAQTIVSYYDGKLQLSPEQETEVGVLAEEFVKTVAKTQPRTKKRLAVFNEYYPRLRALLREDQHAAFDQLTDEHRQKMRSTAK